LLTRLDVDRVLVTHGEPVLQNGAREPAASLTRPPWRRSSLYWIAGPITLEDDRRGTLLGARG